MLCKWPHAVGYLILPAVDPSHVTWPSFVSLPLPVSPLFLSFILSLTLSLKVSKRCSVLLSLMSLSISILLTLLFVPCSQLSLYLFPFYDWCKDFSFPFCFVIICNYLANNLCLCTLNSNHDEYICQTEGVKITEWLQVWQMGISPESSCHPWHRWDFLPTRQLCSVISA